MTKEIAELKARVDNLENCLFGLIDKLNQCNIKADVEFDDLETTDNEAEEPEDEEENDTGETYE